MQILDIVAESVNVFDEVNVATALHRLAKLQPPTTAGQASPVIYADHFQQLVLAIKRQLQRFEAQAVSNTLWGKHLRVHHYRDQASKLHSGFLSTGKPELHLLSTPFAAFDTAFCPGGCWCAPREACRPVKLYPFG